jgi:histidyl-tRNA synthetase
MLNTEPGDLGKRLRYADRMGFPYVVVVGANEVSSNTVSLKDMGTKETQSVTVDDLLIHLK